MEKVLFMVPHEDDELLIGGPLLIELVRDKKYDVFVFIATNGDYHPEEHETRIHESLSVLSNIGVRKDHILFGGYGDSWKGTHIYNSAPDVIKESQGGFRETYLCSGMHEWHYIRFHRHQEYTRNAYLKDIEDLISFLLPDVILCVDMDSHGDHRCLSLLAEEAIGNILKSSEGYYPTVLKKYAYQSVLFGIDDYFIYPHRRTKNKSGDTPNPYLKWGERISYRVPKDCNTLFLRNNYLFKLAGSYKSQDVMRTHAVSFINSDIVYWIRNTRNACLKSDITVSSGDKSYLNDFKLIDSEDVNLKKCDHSRLCWRPQKEDPEKEIIIRLADKIDAKYLRLYMNYSDHNCGAYTCEFISENVQQKNIRKKIRKAAHYCTDTLDISGIEFDTLILSFAEIEGDFGIGEIEILEKEPVYPFPEYIYHRADKEESKIVRYLYNFLLKCEKKLFEIQMKKEDPIR